MTISILLIINIIIFAASLLFIFKPISFNFLRQVDFIYTFLIVTLLVAWHIAKNFPYIHDNETIAEMIYGTDPVQIRQREYQISFGSFLLYAIILFTIDLFA